MGRAQQGCAGKGTLGASCRSAVLLKHFWVFFVLKNFVLPWQLLSVQQHSEPC